MSSQKADYKHIYLISVELSRDEGNIVGWEVEAINNKKERFWIVSESAI